MRILFLHQHFHPETVGTSTRAVEIVEYLAARGHEVTVVTGQPSHPSTMRSGETARRQPRFERFRGATVHRVWAFGSAGRDTFLRRMMTYASFMIVGGAKALFLRGKYDVLVAISPLPNGVAGWLVSRVRGIPLMFDVCDIWPDCATAVGMLNNPLLVRTALFLETMIYRRARRIGVVTRGFTENLAAKGVPRGKIALLPDWVEPEIYTSTTTDRDAMRADLALGDKFVVSFLGNFGLLMGLETIFVTARALRDTDPDVLLLFVGKGVAQPMMEEMMRTHELTNVRIVPYQPRERVPALLAASDALIVTYMKNDITRITVPSKIYEYMSSERPIVAGVEGVIREILEEAECGLVSATRNPEELAAHIRTLRDDAALRARMGAAGREYVRRHFTFAKVSSDYERTLLHTAAGTDDPLPTDDATPRPTREAGA